MPDQVSAHITAKSITLAANSAGTSNTVEVGTLKVSGSKLYVRGASKYELVTSA